MLDENGQQYGGTSIRGRSEFWLEQGRRIVSDYMDAVQAASKGLMTVLAMSNAAYLAVLGFAECTPQTMPLIKKVLFVTPPLFWLAALYYCLRVLMVEQYDIDLSSPSDVRTKIGYILEDKHDSLRWAFWLLLTGVVDASLLMVFRLGV